MDAGICVVAVVAAVEIGVVAVAVLVVVRGAVTVRVDAIVPGLGGPRVDAGVGVQTVGAAVGVPVVAVVVLVVVRCAVAVLVDAVVPDLACGWVDAGVRVVAVCSAIGVGVVAVAVAVVVRGTIAVLVDTVVPDLGGAGVDGGVRVVAVGATTGCGVGVVAVTVGVAGTSAQQEVDLVLVESVGGGGVAVGVGEEAVDDGVAAGPHNDGTQAAAEGRSVAERGSHPHAPHTPARVVEREGVRAQTAGQIRVSDRDVVLVVAGVADAEQRAAGGVAGPVLVDGLAACGDVAVEVGEGGRPVLHGDDDQVPRVGAHIALAGGHAGGAGDAVGGAVP